MFSLLHRGLQISQIVSSWPVCLDLKIEDEPTIEDLHKSCLKMLWVPDIQSYQVNSLSSLLNFICVHKPQSHSFVIHCINFKD